MSKSSEEMPAEAWVPVGRYPTLAEANDHGLVILAMGEAYRVDPAAATGEYELEAEESPAARITEELAAYGREQEEARRTLLAPPLRWPVFSAGWAGTGLWAALLVAVFLRQATDPRLLANGASSSTAIFGEGEWWRPLTALFLHADAAHLAGNLLAGTILASLVAKTLGPWRGWALVLACGTAANALNAWLHFPGRFESIGASTAVFAALGLLCGAGLLESLRSRARMPWLRVAAPVLAGLVMLGWMGGGEDPHTDVAAHLLGFGCGLGTGSVAGALLRPLAAPDA